ncbi:MAG: carboxy terminal-processing peptidase [Gammaproteobacteria bacterium]|nr:carboxy terminal-processing peptidase [Gammaproteobacteria bacterium]
MTSPSFRRFFHFLTVVLALFCGAVQATAPIVPIDQLTPQSEHRRATRLITHFIANYHYKKAVLDDELSEVIFDNYLDALDPTKSYLLQSDIDEFSAYSKELDDDLRNSDLRSIFEMFVRYRQRVEARVDYALGLLNTPFNFNVDESFLFDRKDAKWPANDAEVNELWRKRVKNDWLSLRLAGKKDKDIKTTLAKRYEGLKRLTEQFNSEDVFQTFINAYTTAIDPHTAYFSPRSSENFKIRMSLSLEGIGAVLQSDNEYTMVREVVHGGPAGLSGKLHANDRIVGIGQGAAGEITDVVGWRLDDVVDLIRGPKGSVVQLQILPKGAGPDGTTRTIKLTRNTIALDEQAAKKKIIEVTNAGVKQKIGVIELPTFYMDFEARMQGNENYRSTTRDVRKLIVELARENIAGLIIDLRSNGGGSLSEATELTGLFIGTGPVVQVKNSQGRVQLERDTDSEIAYSGPLAVLVDRNSASASEIFAAAIQDYHRGLILGEPTFGKGTVQNLVDLNRFDEEANGKLGQLKATIAQFFRVEGDSTQFRGVVPDVSFSTGFSAKDQGERALKHSLPFAHIAAVNYTPVHAGFEQLDVIRKEHDERAAKDPAFQALLAQERAVQQAADKKEISLLETKRKAEHETTRREQNVRENQIRVAHGLAPNPLKETEGDSESDDAGATTENDDKNKFDVVLEEAAKVVRDFAQGGAESAHRMADAQPVPMSTHGDTGTAATPQMEREKIH